MRLKLVLLVSLLGAAIGTGISIAMVELWRHGLYPAVSRSLTNRPLAMFFYAPTIIIAVFTTLFAYRHTAHRRKFQAALTGILTIAFWLMAVAAIYLS